MAAFAFDTHKAVRTLADAGMAAPVAEAVVETMNGAVADSVAAKADVADVKTDIVKIEGSVARLEGDIADVKTDVAKTNGRLDAMKAEISSIEWALGFISTVVLLMAGPMFGAL